MSHLTYPTSIPATTSTFDLHSLRALGLRLNPAQIEHMLARGELVAKYRRYYEGDHDANMTPEMRKMLRVQSQSGQGEFNDNYMIVVCDTMSDRITLDTVDADNDAASAWSQAVLEDNNGDSLGDDVHSAAVRDGDSFVMVSWDDAEGRVALTYEAAFDGECGVIPVYASANSSEMYCALKIWQIYDESGDMRTRVNIYYADHLEKYQSLEGGQFMPVLEDGGAGNGWYDWSGADGGIGIPIVHFRNRATGNYGMSELKNAIPLQDSLNRTMHSLVMAEELTAFRVPIANGWQPSGAIMPGTILAIPAVGAEMHKPSTEVLEAGDLSQIINAAVWKTAEIGRITRTPAPEFSAGDNASGEALKQREIGLLGKVQRFQVKAGNAWETVMKLAHRVQATFGKIKPPPYTRFYARWRDAEIRNDKATVETVLMIADRIGDRETLRLLSGVWGWDEERIAKILEDRTNDTATRMASAFSTLPGYGNFDNSFNQQPDQGVVSNG